MSSVEDLPTCVQGSPAPMFSGDGAEDLSCHCGQVLISGYRPRQFSGILLECFNCGSATHSGSWPRGEPLPHTIVTLGKTGRYRLSGTVDIRGKAGFTTDHEIERVGLETAPRPSSDAPLDFRLEGLSRFENETDQLAAGALTKSIASVKRAQKAVTGGFSVPLLRGHCVT